MQFMIADSRKITKDFNEFNGESLVVEGGL